MDKEILIKENSFESAKKKIISNKDSKIIFTSDNDDLNRKILEKLTIDYLLINLKKRKDFQKQRNSGFNSVLARIAKKRNVSIGINFDEIIESKGKIKSDIIARIQQNIKLCNKNKIFMKFFSEKYKRNLYDLRALGLVLGMPTWMIKFN